MSTNPDATRAPNSNATLEALFTSHAPLTVWEMLDEEYWAFRGMAPSSGRREAAKSEDPEKRMYAELWLKYMEAKNAADTDGRTNLEEAEKAFRDCLCRRLGSEQHSALCFSGGGIRSATFGLGVLQGLARRSCDAEHPEVTQKLLSEFQYLSTVSGGGYLGGWFSAWIKREGRDKVIRQLASRPASKLDPEPQPIRHLRRFSNYLNPKLGLLSADTWTLVATMIRNMLLNWLVLLPMIAAVLLVPKIGMDLAKIPNVPAWGTWLAGVVGFLAGALAFAYTVRKLPGRDKENSSQRGFLLFCIAPLTLSVLGLSLSWSWVVAEKGLGYFSVVDFIVFVAAVLGLGALLGISPILKSREKTGESNVGSTSKHHPLWEIPVILIVGAAVAAATGWLMHALFTALFDISLRTFTVFAGSGVMGIVIVTQALLVGLVSWVTGDEDREWWARAGAWVYIVMLAWTAGAGLVLFASPLFDTSIHGLRWLGAAILSSASLGGIASALGLSSKTPATDVKIPFSALSKSQIAAKLAAPVTLTGFLVLLVLSVAGINEELLDSMGMPGLAGDFSLAGIFLVAALVLSRPINVNRFSLHAMYRTRLIRAFLGASNTNRKQNEFTGFDPNDNCSLHDLKAAPLHVVNMALNLLQNENLAWQERKAESFTASALHSGSMRVGYQHSEDYAKSSKFANGITLGGAMAISGAAASPNMGYHSSPLMTMVMMLFNARLGAWLANPGKEGSGLWRDPGPKYALLPFIHEAFGMTTDKCEWVYLSDGGHFENLGLYEMVLRRCHFILAVDASADCKYHYEDLANAIRKIRIDLGIPIEFKSLPFSPEGKLSGKHFAVGKIHYRHVDGNAEDGVLIYIKPSLNGNEPTDVTTYHNQYATFPHQTTADQWFDESQFESYRCLGEHIIDELMDNKEEICELEEFFRRAQSASKKSLWEVAHDALGVGL